MAMTKGAPRGRQIFHFMKYTWDVDAALRLAEGRSTISVQRADLDGLLGFMRVNTTHAATVDLSKPLIAVPLAEGIGLLVIDGWHRVYRANMEGVETLQMVVLSEKEERAIRLAL